MPGVDQHQFQRSRRTDRVHSFGRVSLLHGDNMDVLVINDFVLLKQNQSGGKTHATDEHLAQFQLD